MLRGSHLIILAGVSVLLSCNRLKDSFYAEDVPAAASKSRSYAELDASLNEDNNVNINVEANGNYTGQNEAGYIINISGANHAYCHPDVQYFSQGFNGYKYWMVFTPYFGSVAATPSPLRFENPTVVVSNDGTHWIPPPGIKNPIASAPSLKESFLDKSMTTKQGFWSDPDWLFSENKFDLYYRGCYITASALKKRGAKSKNNANKLKSNAQRTIVRQTSTDGINWTPLEAVFNSNAPHTPQNDHLISPTFVKSDKGYISYEVELNTGKQHFKGNSPSYIIQRTSKDGLNFSYFNKSKIVNFVNEPWKTVDQTYSPWHIHVCYIDHYYFLTLAVGDVKKYTANQLYLAYSVDGLNFHVLPKPLISQNAYRSAIFPMDTDNESIHFGAILAYKTGEFKYKEFTLPKSTLEIPL